MQVRNGPPCRHVENPNAIDLMKMTPESDLKTIFSINLPSTGRMLIGLVLAVDHFSHLFFIIGMTLADFHIWGNNPNFRLKLNMAYWH